MSLAEAIERVERGEVLERAEARAAVEAVLNQPDAESAAAFLLALARRGESGSEVAGGADALRGRMTVFEHDHPGAIDTCGTGGDGQGTFNLSTAAAIVAAAAGARVIKHGNRAASSSCGSADLLEALGLPLELEPPAARAVLDEVGITFLFAPRYHPALAAVAPLRRRLGVRTIFNLLGPLCHPGRVRRQLLGVASEDLLDPFAQALLGLGHERALVVHGAGGADELTLAGPNRLRAIGCDPGPLGAAELGLSPARVAALRGGDARRNAELLRGVLAARPGPLLDAVVLNAGAALIVAGVEQSAAAAVQRARDAVCGGEAAGVLDRWVQAGARRAGGSA